MRKMLITALTLLTLALPAMAQKPTIQLIPLPASGVVGPTASACGFDVLATPQAGRPNGERLILFANTGIIVGPLFVTLRNLSTGKTIDVNVSGPQLLSSSGTNVSMGSGIFAFPPPPPDVATAAGLPLVPLVHGRTVFTTDEQGNILSIQSFTGTAEDVCQLLR